MIKNAALMLVGVAIALLLGEGVLRITGWFPPHTLHSVSANDYERIPGFWEPGQDFVNLEIPALPHRIRINSLGLRGSETTLDPKGPRILCIGDSFTFGDFVNDHETLPAQLADGLAGKAEVLNGGVGSTTIVDQRVFLNRLLRLRPNVVLLTFSETDLYDLLVSPPMHVQFAQNRELKSSFLRPVFQLVRDTALFHALLRLRGLLRTRQVQLRTVPAAIPEAIVGRYTEEVVQIRDLLKTQGIALLFAAFPSHHTVAGRVNVDRIGPVLRALADVGIAGIDLTLPLRRSGLPITELYLLPYDGHASARGNAIAATAILPHVVQVLERDALL